MMMLNGTITVLLTVLAMVFLPALMRLMNTPDSIFCQAYSYMAVICCGMLATIVSQAVSGVLTGVYVYRAYGRMMPRKDDFRLENGITKEMLSTGGAMAFMYSVVSLGSVVYQGATNVLGEIAIAAFTAFRRIHNILIQPMSTIMDASGTFTAQNWGAKQKRRIRETLRRVMFMEAAWGFLCVAIVYLFGGDIIRLTTGTRNPEMISLAVTGLRIHFSM